MRRILAVVIVTAAALTAGGFAYAESQPADPSVPADVPADPLSQIAPSEAPPAAEKAEEPTAPEERARRRDTQAQRRRPGGGLRPMKGAIHGELLLMSRDGETREVVFDRGRLVSVSESSITIERPDQQTVSAAVTPETKFNGTPREQLESGTPVLVVADPAGKALRVVSKRPPEEARPRAQRRPRV